MAESALMFEDPLVHVKVILVSECRLELFTTFGALQVASICGADIGGLRNGREVFSHLKQKVKVRCVLMEAIWHV